MRTDLKGAKDAVEALAAQHGIVVPAGSGCLGAVALLWCGLSLLAVGGGVWPADALRHAIHFAAGTANIRSSAAEV